MHVTAVVSTAMPVLVVSGNGAPVCTKAATVSAIATTGSAVSGGVGTVGMEPLDPGALEVLASGSAPDGSVRLWWTAVAVGPGIARVAAEDPSGVADAARPVNGVAVLGGTSTEPGYYSVVAETASGQALGSLGFRTGWGPKVRATSELTSGSLGNCASDPSVTLTPVSSTSPAPVAPLLAASSVVASFDQAYSSSPGQAIVENLAVVADGRRLVRHGVSSRAAVASDRSHRASGASAVAVEVSTVAFLSAHRAEVAYRVDGGAWRTGNAVLGAGGRWLVSVRTYCADVVARVPQRGPVVAAVSPACRALLSAPG